MIVLVSVKHFSSFRHFMIKAGTTTSISFLMEYGRTSPLISIAIRKQTLFPFYGDIDNVSPKLQTQFLDV